MAMLVEVLPDSTLAVPRAKADDVVEKPVEAGYDEDHDTVCQLGKELRIVCDKWRSRRSVLQQLHHPSLNRMECAVERWTVQIGHVVTPAVRMRLQRKRLPMAGGRRGGARLTVGASPPAIELASTEDRALRAVA